MIFLDLMIDQVTVGVKKCVCGGSGGGGGVCARERERKREKIIGLEKQGWNNKKITKRD